MCERQGKDFRRWSAGNRSTGDMSQCTDQFVKKMSPPWPGGRTVDTVAQLGLEQWESGGHRLGRDVLEEVS